MAEYISRDDALNFEMEIEVPPDSIQAVTTGMTMLLDYIKKIPAADVVERKTGKWIPVTERLPEAGKKVLVFAYGYDTITARMCKKTEDGYPVFECKGYDGIYREMARAGRISHWMPLPEPPESDGE